MCNKNEVCEKIFKLQPKFIAVLKDFKNSAYGEIYLTSYQMWKDNIFLGIGLNNFKELCINNNKYKKYHQNFGCTSHPHNMLFTSITRIWINWIYNFFLFYFFNI